MSEGKENKNIGLEGLINITKETEVVSDTTGVATAVIGGYPTGLKPAKKTKFTKKKIGKGAKFVPPPKKKKP